MKHIITLIALVVIFITTNAQTDKQITGKRISYAYDNAGNRESRTIALKKQEPALKTGETASGTTNTQQAYNEILAGQKVRIYPNPTKGNLSVEIADLERDTEGEINIYNMSGKQVYSKRNLRDYNRININNLPAGTYIMKIRIDSELSEWKIVKQ